jgi:hypothetical protein
VFLDVVTTASLRGRLEEGRSQKIRIVPAMENVSIQKAEDLSKTVKSALECFLAALWRQMKR